MIYAQVQNGVVQNTIVLDDASLIPRFTQGYDALIDITNSSPSPDIGWTWDPNSGVFTPPSGS